jgi:hypothetical protein
MDVLVRGQHDRAASVCDEAAVVVGEGTGDHGSRCHVFALERSRLVSERLWIEEGPLTCSYGELGKVLSGLAMDVKVALRCHGVVRQWVERIVRRLELGLWRPRLDDARE